MPKTVDQIAIQSTLTTLFKAASFIGSKRFLTLYHSESFRFLGDPSSLFTKLRSLFHCQICQCVAHDAARAFRKESNLSTSVIPVEYAAPFIAEQILSLAKRIGSTDTVLMADRKFTVKRGESLLDAAFAAFNVSATNKACVTLGKLDYPGSSLGTFDVRNLLCEFGKFIESLHTLSLSTENPRFERLLRSLVTDINYFVKGYPYDILAHDVVGLREGNIVGIHTRNDYCSSYSVTETSDVSIDSDVYSYHPM